MPDVPNNAVDSQVPVQTPQPVVSNPVNPTQVSSQTPATQNPQNNVNSTRIPKSASIALITAILYLFLIGSFALFMTSIYGAVGLHGGKLTSNQVPGLILIGIGGLIFPILTILNIVLGVKALLNYQKNRNKKVLLIGVFATIVGVLPILAWVIGSFLIFG